MAFSTVLLDLDGVVCHFDPAHRPTINTWDIGFAKPDPRAFRHCCDMLDVAPSEVFFTDDSESKLGGAIELGMTARHFTDVATFRRHLDELGIG